MNSKSKSFSAARGFAVACAGATLLAAGAAAADPLGSPSISAPLSGNPNPFSVDGGPFGKVYVSGALTGIAIATDHNAPGEQDNQLDISNAQVVIQNTSGPVQFYVQAGQYDQPFLGVPYMKSVDATKANFGNVPFAYLKFQFTPELSVQAGKLPTLIGDELPFTFQNTNVVRGLLVFQEPVSSRGVQVNYAKGPYTLSVSLNDGYYSNKLNWVSGAFTWVMDPANTFVVSGGGALSKSSVSAFTTPPAQNNGWLVDLIWTHTQGPWMIQPYFQYTHTPKHPELGVGIDHEASTWGGAVLGKYSFTPTWSLGARAEYIKSDATGCNDGDVDTICSVGLLGFGPKAGAWSLTLTPTWQKGIFFARGEISYTHIDDALVGFGQSGTEKAETRGVIETGVLF